MKRFLLAAFVLVTSLAATGCGPIKYEHDIDMVAGRRVFVEPARISNCHAALNKEAVEAEIHKTAEDYLQHYGFTVVQDPDSADLILKADVAEFNLGSTTARVLIGGGQAWHDTAIVMHPKGFSVNVGHRRAEVSAGAYGNWKGAEAHQHALVDEIAKMHVWVAQKSCP
ncbi:MAG: hypothetical protein K8T20_16165 [Planctomycetes bacterium]|nr:hypothetical protein [Planctomycetota bacterium]